MSDSVRPQRRQPTRLLLPWDSPGKNTGVGCHFLLQCVKVKVAQSARLLATPWTAAYQAPPSVGVSTDGVGCHRFRLYILSVWILWFYLAQFHKNRDLKVQGSAPEINSTVNVAYQFMLKTTHPPDRQIQISPERVVDCLDNLTSPRHVSHQAWPILKEQVVLGCQS